MRSIGSIDSNMELSGSRILFLYTFFENVAECIIGNCSAWLINLECSEDICLRIEAQVKDRVIPVDFMHDRIEEFAGILQIENEQDAIFITLTLPVRVPAEDKNDIV